jgi:hypothetical protein
VRLDDAQHHLHGNGRVDRGAAASKHFQTGLDGERMRRRHHRLRRRQDGRHAAGRHQQQCQDGEQAAELHARRATMNSLRKGKIVMPSARVG